jgi:hypothetical protein
LGILSSSGLLNKSIEYCLNDYKNGSKVIIDIFSKIKGEIIDINENLQCLSAKYLLEKAKLSINEIQLLANRIMNGQPRPEG